MVASFVERFRNEPEVGVPRRFSIGTLFVLLTLYCVLFRVLILFGADTTWTALICLFFSAVTIGQMALFRGARPRAASIVSGSLVCPAMLVAYSIDEVVTQWSEWTPLENGLRDPRMFTSAFFLLAMVGAAFGYLFGCMTAGVFYVMHQARPNTGFSEAAVDEPSRRGSVVWLSAIGSWLNPIQPQRPLRGALAVFLLPIVFGVLLSPFIFWFLPRDVLMMAATMGACFALWSGNLQLRVFWPIMLCSVGAATATGAAHVLRQIPFFQDTFRQDPNVLLYLVRVVGGFTGLTFSAVAGWLQWATLRNRIELRFGWKPLAFSIALLFSTTYLVTNRLEAWAHSPAQKLFRTIKEGGGTVYWSGFMQVQAVDLNSESGDEQFLRLRPTLDRTSNVNLFGPSFSNVSVSVLSGLNLNGLMLSETAITDEAFDEVTRFSAAYVYLNGTQIGDRGVTRLAAIPEIQQGLTALILDRTQISDAAILHLATCKSLTMLSMSDCKITGSGFENLSAIPGLTILQLDRCPLGDASLKTLVSAAPKLQRLSLVDTRISDAGLAHLSQAKILRGVILDGTLVTREGVNELQKALPRCTIKWNDPDEGRVE